MLQMYNMKVFYILLLAFFLLKSLQLPSQNDYIAYYNKISEAESSFCNREFKTAEYLYLEAFQYSDPLFRDILNYSRCLIVNKSARIDSVRKIILSSAKKRGPYLSFHYKKDSILQVLDTSGFFEDLRHMESGRKIDSIALTKVQLLLAVDQFVRIQASDGCAINIIDDFIESELLKMIAESGYPGYRLIGTDEASVLLSHMANSKNVEKIEKILYLEVKKGNLEPVHFGYFIDRRYSMKNQCGLNMLYTKNLCNGKTDTEVINRRKEFGITTLNPKYYRTYKLDCEK